MKARKMRKPLKSLDFLLLLSILSFCISIDSVQGLYCYVCSSDKLEECSTLHSIEELPLELCSSDIASCFIRIENGVTIRGCLPHRKQTLCSTDSCSFCRSNKCNSQIFPEDRLSCLHCEGSSCVNQSNTIDVRYPCANYIKDDECYSIFSYDGSTAYRGCMSDNPNPNKDFCIDNFPQCTRCEKRACNSDHVQFEKKIACVKCTPDENSNCNVVDDSTTAIECAPTTLGYKNLCYTFQKGNVSHRGCLYEAPGDIFVECNNPYSEACLTCNQTDCNRTPIVNEDLTLNPFHYEVIRNDGKSELVLCDDPKCTKLSPWERFCYKCDSNINPNCTDQLDETMIGICDFEQEDLGCYHMITETGAVRGCVKDLEGEIKQKCMANDDSCKTCFERDCNAKVNFSECLVTDEDQSKAWNNFESLSSPKICKKYDEQCFVQVIKEDTVIRGCLDTYAAQIDLPSNFLDAVENNKTYRVCSGHLCNDEEVKPLYCQSCNSTEKDCIADPMHLYFRKRCKPLEVSQAGCYHFDNGSYVERGCISHLEETQRAECESNSDRCKKCYENECNSKRKFLTCVWSLNDNVSRLEKLCRAYNDECFILAKNGAVRRGCMSDLIYKPEPGIDIMSDRRNLDIYERCLSDNCNSRELESEYCMACTSEIDGKNQCRYSPTTNMRQKCPMRVKKLGCYLQQGDIWKRGCVSQLTPDERYECRALNGTCKICHGDTCNKKQSFQICKTCSSEDDEDCISRPWMSNEITCPNYMDQCYVHIKDGIVKRNCIGDSFMNSAEECANSEHCMHCSGYKCNGKQIHQEVCYACDSYINATCKSISFLEEPHFTQECPISIQTQGCYHFIDKNDAHHIRGCVNQLSDDEKKRYNQKTDEFKICTESKCNKQRFLERCLVCNSTENPDCATTSNSSYSKVCDSYRNMCFTRILPRSVIRGCFNDIKEAAQIQCSYDKERCKICRTNDGIGCNNIAIDTDTCIECDSTEDEGCRLKPKETDQRICAHVKSPKRKGCYLSIVGDHTKRGCIQDLTPSDGQECLNGSETCKSCDWSNCNTKTTFQECYNCNSKDDPRCAREAQSAKTEICKTYYSQCTTGIDQQGYTHRGCSMGYKDIMDAFALRYNNCEENKCNYGIFPENRLKCYQCNGDENCNFMSPNSTDIDLQPQPCGISSDFDQCFTYINKEKKMFRGCLSDSTPIRLECDLDGENKQGTCVKCTTSGCNNQPKVKIAELSCAKCSDKKECAFGQSSTSANTCLNDVTFGDDESCFVYTLPGNNAVERGCTLDVNASDTNWCQEGKGCEKCFTKGCNTQNVRFSWCLRCQSDATGNCAKVSNPNEFIEECDHLPYPYGKRGCYTNFKDGNITRGCNIDLSEDQYENCRKDDSCTLCQDDYCNKEEINSSSRTSANTLVCIFVLLITHFSSFLCDFSH